MAIRGNTLKFIEEAHVVHKNEYGYSKINYIKSNVRVCIICSKHGEFLQKPNNHLNGSGCPKCYGNEKYTMNDFIKKSINVHGNIYDYSKSKYIGNNIPICIICKKHGEFWQVPSSHWYGFGCAKCACYRISKPELKFLDYIKINNTNRQVKILRKKVDGYDPQTNTIYEFLGDYWHGNPVKFNLNDVHPRIKKTFGQLYKETIDKFQKLKSNGYSIKYIWESDWNNFEKGIDNLPKIMEYSTN